jgi:hypothetical protein
VTAAPLAPLPPVQDALVAQVVVALAGGAPALALALWGWWLERRGDRAQIKALQEDNAKLLVALTLALNGRKA